MTSSAKAHLAAGRTRCKHTPPARGPTDGQLESYRKRTDWVLCSDSRRFDSRRGGWLLTRLRECRHHDCQQGAVRSATDKICDRRRLRSITDHNRMRFGSERAAQSAQSSGHAPAFRGHRAIFGECAQSLLGQVCNRRKPTSSRCILCFLSLLLYLIAYSLIAYCFFVLNLLKFSSHLLNFFSYFFAYSLLAYFGFFFLFSLIFADLLKVLIFVTTEKSLRIGGLFGLWLASHNPPPPISKNARQKCQKCQNQWSASRQITTPQI